MELKKLKDIEKSVDQAAKKLEKVDGELTGLKNVSIGCIKSLNVCVSPFVFTLHMDVNRVEAWIL